MAAVWLGSNFTLLYPGHAHKPVVVLFFICSLLPVVRAAAGSIPHAVIWGGCIGLMFVQQPDVALFFALFAGAYFVFLLWNKQGFKPLRWFKVLVPAGVVAFIFAVGPLLGGYEQYVKGAAQMQEGDPKAKWNYVTQWSVPPDEVIDFIAPGYFGLRSNEPAGPYWGRTGQSADWEKTKQGFRNFKLESTYIGFIPVAFALFALFACRRSKHRAEILFWAGAALVALLLSFGRYFPLYALFFKLPAVNNIRNPNKFIQVFQVCLAILSAYGFDALWHSRGKGGTGAEKGSPVRAFFWTLLGIVFVLGLGALVLALGQQSGISGFVADGWPRDAAEIMVKNRAVALGYATGMAFIVLVVFALFTFRKFVAFFRYRNIIGALLVLVVAADVVKLSKHYVKEMPRSYIEANVLTGFLKANLGEQRVALLSQDGVNNIWITYLFPYNRIPTFNFTDMPRMANDYTEFLSAGQRNPLNMWRFSSVKYLLAPAGMEPQLAPAGCRKVLNYALQGAGNGEFKVVAYPNGPFAVYELQGSLPRFALFAGSEKVADEQVLPSALTDLSKVYLPSDSTLPELTGKGLGGQVEMISSRPGRVKLKVMASAPSILRVAEKYNPDWKAKVDGKAVIVERVDYLCQGVFIPAGEHEVALRYAPGRLYFYLQCSGMVLLLGALVMGLHQRNRGDVAD